VENFFSKMTRQRIRRGVFRSVIAAADDGAVEHAEGGEQGGADGPHSGPQLVPCRLSSWVMVWQRPGLIGSQGWVRSSAWIWLFSSSDSTTAWAGGST
jgi:hypothetical protein